MRGAFRPRGLAILVSATLVAGWQTAGMALTAAAPRAAVSSDEALEVRVHAIVAGMTLEQKIGQMTQADIRSITPDDVRRYYIGSILNGGGAGAGVNPPAGAAERVKVSHTLYRASMSSDMRVKIPLLSGT